MTEIVIFSELVPGLKAMLVFTAAVIAAVVLRHLDLCALNRSVCQPGYVVG